ncbi:MAG: hypothetical protein HY901_32100, partial [Deltaproteobacteria bacterium]|nr:hypothetical protein [Deltaproteobacteria bacterium]
GVQSQVQEQLEGCFTEGVGAVGDRAVVGYIGEAPTDVRFLVGLSASGQVAQLLGAFLLAKK